MSGELCVWVARLEDTVCYKLPWRYYSLFLSLSLALSLHVEYYCSSGRYQWMNRHLPRKCIYIWQHLNVVISLVFAFVHGAVYFERFTMPERPSVAHDHGRRDYERASSLCKHILQDTLQLLIVAIILTADNTVANIQRAPCYSFTVYS